MTLVEKLQYMKCFARKIQKIHEFGIVHRDVKWQNFLYNKARRKGYLIDFGLCEFVKEKLSFQQFLEEKQIVERILHIQKNILGEFKQGTRGYMPVEQLLDYEVNRFSTDIFSLGLVFLQISLEKNCIFGWVHVYMDKGLLKKDLDWTSSFLVQMMLLYGSKSVI